MGLSENSVSGYWLVVSNTLKNMSSSMGRMTSHIYEMENNTAMFETTNQVITLTPGFLRLLYDVEHGFREAK